MFWVYRVTSTQAPGSLPVFQVSVTGSASGIDSPSAAASATTWSTPRAASSSAGNTSPLSETETGAISPNCSTDTDAWYVPGAWSWGSITTGSPSPSTVIVPAATPAGQPTQSPSAVQSSPPSHGGSQLPGRYTMYRQVSVSRSTWCHEGYGSSHTWPPTASDQVSPLRSMIVNVATGASANVHGARPGSSALSSSPVSSSAASSSAATSSSVSPGQPARSATIIMVTIISLRMSPPRAICSNVPRLVPHR